VFQLENSSKWQQAAISTFENHCLVGELSFGDPFQESGVVVQASGFWIQPRV